MNWALVEVLVGAVVIYYLGLVCTIYVCARFVEWRNDEFPSVLISIFWPFVLPLFIPYLLAAQAWRMGREQRALAMARRR